MNRRRLRLAIVSISITAGAGCSLLVGTDGLTGRASGTVGEGGTDAAPSGDVVTADVRAQRFCAAIDAAFCEDFDDQEPLPGTRWSAVDTNGGVTFQKVADQDAASAPNVGYARTVQLDASSSGSHMTLIKGFDAVVTRASVSWDMRIDRFAAQYVNTVTLGFRDGTSFLYLLQAGASPTETLLEEYWETNGSQAGSVTKPSAAAQPTGKWVHYELRLDRSLSVITMLVDNAVLLARSLSQVDLSRARLELQVGTQYALGPGVFEAAIDNVVVTYQ